MSDNRLLSEAEEGDVPALVRSHDLPLRVPVTVHHIHASVTPDLTLTITLSGDWGQTVATMRVPLPNPILYPSDEFELVPRYEDTV